MKQLYYRIECHKTHLQCSDLWCIHSASKLDANLENETKTEYTINEIETTNLKRFKINRIILLCKHQCNPDAPTQSIVINSIPSKKPNIALKIEYSLDTDYTTQKCTCHNTNLSNATSAIDMAILQTNAQRKQLVENTNKITPQQNVHPINQIAYIAQVNNLHGIVTAPPKSKK